MVEMLGVVVLMAELYSAKMLRSAKRILANFVVWFLKRRIAFPSTFSGSLSPGRR